MKDANQFLHIREVAKATRIGHAGRELQLNQRGKADIMDSVDLDRHLLRIGKRDRLRLSVAGKLTGNDKLDSNSGPRIADVLAAFKDRTIT
jgi:hypothetical protein